MEAAFPGGADANRPRDRAATGRAPLHHGRMTTSIDKVAAGEQARAAIYDEGITALRGGFTVDWADAMRADIEAAFAEASARPGGAVGRGPHRYYVEIHPEQLRGFADLAGHPWVDAVCTAVLGA